LKRSILLALVAALAVAVGFSPAATAGVDSGAHASAKKGKGCKGKKGKGKAGKSAVASAKKKGKGCKPQGKTGSWPPSAGTYDGQDGVGLSIKAGGKQAALTFSPELSEPNPKTCIPIGLEFPEEPATTTATLFKAGGKPIDLFGGNGQAKWSIQVKPNLNYTLELSSSFSFADQDPCDKPGVVFKGTLTKAG